MHKYIRTDRTGLLCMRHDVKIAEATLNSVQLPGGGENDLLLATDGTDPSDNAKNYLEWHNTSTQQRYYGGIHFRLHNIAEICIARKPLTLGMLGQWKTAHLCMSNM